MIKQISKQTTPLCFLPSGKLVCYKHGHILLLREGKHEKTYCVFNSIKERLLSRFNFLYRFLRMGIRTAEVIDNENIVVSIGNMLYEFNLSIGKLSNGYFCGVGIRPLIFSTVNNIETFDNGIYFGGYLDNMDKDPVNIYRRNGVDQWDVVYTFPKGAINHVHNIIPDPYRNCLWIFTGDFDEASAIWKMTDNFKKVEQVAYNNQKYRGCVAFAIPEGLLYATDAPFADDYIYLMNLDTYGVQELLPINGSCIYGCQWKDKYVFSSTVEGDGRRTTKMEFLFGRKRGAGIKDEYVYMYCGNLKQGFQEIYKEKKDCMPYYTFQFGVFMFPCGINNGDSLLFKPVATNKNDMHLISIGL